MAKFGIGQQMTVAKQGRSQASADGDDEHHAGDALAGPEPDFGQPGDLSYIYPPQWDERWKKRQGFPLPTLRDLVKAGALITAEIDRRLLAGEEA